MAMATGREPAMDDLLGRVAPPVVLAIPAVCYMEAFSALENDRLHRNRFKDQIEQQISQLKRDTTSARSRLILPDGWGSSRVILYPPDCRATEAGLGGDQDPSS
jgi:hypothetical protein